MAGNDLTIEELAERTGLTPRNLRAYRTQKLLQPPEMRDGVGYYGPGHVARLEQIKQLRAEGFNLKAIERLLRTTESGRDIGELISHAFDAEPPRKVDPAELARRLGDELTPTVIQRAVELGAVRILEDGRLELPTPALLDAATELADRGIPLEPVMPLFELVQRECQVIADAFLDLFVERIWSHFQEAGYPRARWDEVGETVESLRPLASKALLAIFQTTIDSAIDERFGPELEQLTDRAGE